jgi:uncharacterized protein with PIN domain
MEKQSSSQKQKESLRKLKKSKKSSKDLCPVCDENLYLDSTFTQRVGLLDDDDDVYGWMCPFCMSEFSLEGDITRLFRDGKIQGKA